MQKGIRGATLGNYQLCAFKEHYQDKDLQLDTLTHAVPSHPLSPLFPASTLPPRKLSSSQLTFTPPPSFAPHDSRDFSSISTPIFHFLSSCYLFLPSEFLSSIFSFTFYQSSSTSSSELLFLLLLAQNRHLNNEPGVSQTTRELH